MNDQADRQELPSLSDLRARWRDLNRDHERHGDTLRKEQDEIVISESRFRTKESEKSIEDFSLSLSDACSFLCVEA